MPATEELVMTTKIKIKLGTKKFVIDPVSKSCEKNISYVNKWDQGISLKEQSSSAIGTKQKLVSRSDHAGKVFAADHLNDKPYIPGANKRGPSGTLEQQNLKRKKMDRSVTQQCSHVLKKLMTHPAGWVFNQPVDPLSLNIPDYFSVITAPMDLGTIKLKLGKNLYYGAGEFVADVRLTFSNAMLYNPASNNVHLMAKELNDLFSKLCKSFDVNWGYESSEADHGQVLNGRTTKIIVAKQNTPFLQTAPLPERSISFEDRQKLRKELCSVLRKNITPQWRATLQRFGLPLKIDGRFELAFDTLTVDSFLELRNLTRNFVDTSATEVKLAKTIAKRNDESSKNFHKGADSDIRHACALADSRWALGQSSVKCGLCGNATCQCRIDNYSIQESSSDLSSERSLSKDYSSVHGDTFKEIAREEIHQCLVPTNLSRDSIPVSQGTMSAVDEENLCPSSHLSTPVIAEISGEALDIQLSPKRALRAALLKSRFADTILKAQHKTLLDHGDQTDPTKMQKEKEKLEKKQREEKTRIEAEIRAAQAAAQMRIEVGLKTQREKEREAARIALQMVEKTVEIDENIQIIKELEMLSGFSPSDHEMIAESASESSVITFHSPRIGNPLERLGLFMKPEYFGDEEDEDIILNGGGEEGEIIS